MVVPCFTSWHIIGHLNIWDRWDLVYSNRPTSKLNNHGLRPYSYPISWADLKYCLASWLLGSSIECFRHYPLLGRILVTGLTGLLSASPIECFWHQFPKPVTMLPILPLPSWMIFSFHCRGRALLRLGPLTPRVLSPPPQRSEGILHCMSILSFFLSLRLIPYSCLFLFVTVNPSYFLYFHMKIACWPVGLLHTVSWYKSSLDTAQIY